MEKRKIFTEKELYELLFEFLLVIKVLNKFNGTTFNLKLVDKFWIAKFGRINYEEELEFLLYIYKFYFFN
mgnify:CR=1 FL=1